MRTIFIYTLISFFPLLLFSQTPGERMQLLTQEMQFEVESRQQRVEEFLATRNLPAAWQVGEQAVEIIDVQHSRPIYYITLNLSAAKTIRVDRVWEMTLPNYTFTGDGFFGAGIWDYQGVRTTHQEFMRNGTSRVIQKDNPSGLQNHATHCAGSMIAAGVQSSCKGMAPLANLYAYDWNADSYEMAMAAANDNLIISNHSYGMVAGWSKNAAGEWQWYGDASISATEDYMFGLYDAMAKSWDTIAYNAPNYLIVKAAGNDNGEGPGRTTGPPNDGGIDGYDTVSATAVAKNVLTVGSVYDLTNYQQPQDVQISSFSSRGPTDDGRIKPDIVTNGFFVSSCIATSDISYGSSSGTSMASANMAGALILLQQFYLHLHQQPMRSATAKALLIHTADECGSYTGPDFVYGWGLVNAENAIQTIKQDYSFQAIYEQNLATGAQFSLPIRTDGRQPLKATLVWTDPPATNISYTLDSPDPKLVNNLDLKIIRLSNNAINYPFKLNAAAPDAAPTRGENDVDNVEQVLIENPSAGEMLVLVSHKGLLTGGEQAFSLIISGVSGDTTPPDKVQGLHLEN